MRNLKKSEQHRNRPKMAYESFYSLPEDPFRLTPDRRFRFLSQTHSKAWAYLRYALEQGEGFVLITGGPGTGKTTLVEGLLSEIAVSGVMATRVTGNELDPTGFLRHIAYSYGLEGEHWDKATLLHRIEQYLLQQWRIGRRVLLIVDEAQGLSPQALEELRLLSDLQTNAGALLQVFLLGQERLQTMICSPDMDQFRQRVIANCLLEPLDLPATRSYIRHRLLRAGWAGRPELSARAIVSIYEASGGVPRHINKVCSRLLLHGGNEKKDRLDEDDVMAAVGELREEHLTPLLVSNASWETAPQAAAVPVADLVWRGPPPDTARRTGARPWSPAAATKPPATAAAPNPGRPLSERPDPESVVQVRAYGRPSRGHGRGLVRKWRRQLLERLKSLGAEGVHCGSQLARQLKALGAAATQHARQHLRQLKALGNAGAQRVRTLWWRTESNLGPLLQRVQGRTNSLLRGFAARSRGATGPLRALFSSLRLDAERLSLWFGQTDLKFRSTMAGGVLVLSALLLAAIRLDPKPIPAEEAQLAPGTAAEETPTQVAATATGPTELPSPAATDASPESAPTPPEPSLTPLRELARVQPAAGPGAAPDVPIPIEIAGGDVPADPAGPGLTESDREPTAVDASEEAVSAGLLVRTSLLDSPQGQTSLSAPMNPASEQPADETRPGGAAVETESEPTPPAPAPAHLGEDTQPATSQPLAEVPAKDSVDQQVERLIALAETALEKDRLLIPAHDNAFEYYRQILDLEPGNAIAEDGLDRIVKRYQELAQQAASDGDWDEAQRFLGRGLRVRPGDAAVLAMREQVSTEAAKEQLEMALAAEEAALQLQPVAPSEPLEPVEHDGGAPPGTEPRGLMGRLKAFFTRSSEPTPETDAQR